MTPVARVRRVISRPSLLIVTSWSRSREASLHPGEGVGYAPVSRTCCCATAVRGHAAVLRSAQRTSRRFIRSPLNYLVGRGDETAICCAMEAGTPERHRQLISEC